MSKEHHIVYVPGLDDKRKGYNFIINRWRLWSVVPHVYRVGWKDGETHFEPKLQELLRYINNLLGNKYTVSLVGGSAGGSAVLNAFLEQPEINAAVNLFGRLREGDEVVPTLKHAARNSAPFRESVTLFERKEPAMTSEQRRRVMTLTALWDEVVPRTTSTLSGAINKTVPSVEHSLSGLLGMTLFSPIIMGFLKEKAKER